MNSFMKSHRDIGIRSDFEDEPAEAPADSKTEVAASNSEAALVVSASNYLLFKNQQSGIADVLQAFVKTYCDEELIKFLQVQSPAQAKNHIMERMRTIFKKELKIRPIKVFNLRKNQSSSNPHVIVNGKQIEFSQVIPLKEWIEEIPTKILKALKKFEDRITTGRFPLRTLKRHFYVADIVPVRSREEQRDDPWLIMLIEDSDELAFVLSAWDKVTEYK